MRRHTPAFPRDRQQLLDASLIDTQHGYPRIDAGEQASQLVDALGRHVAQADEQQKGREGLLGAEQR